MYYDKIDLNGAALEVYCPDLCGINATGPHRPAIVICGGGAYAYVSDREDEPVALRFLTMGFCTFTIAYHCAPNRFPAGLLDAGRAVAWVRSHAEQLGVDPDKIVICGFSAGGHLAASLAVMWQRAEIFAEAGLKPEDVKPNALVLGYPVITAGEFAHRGSFVNLTGSEDPADHMPYSLENLVSDQTPPAFIWHTWEDQAVPVENSLLLATALRRAGVPTELHIYLKGHHGLSLANELTGTRDDDGIREELHDWPETAGRFLKQVF